MNEIGIWVNSSQCQGQHILDSIQCSVLDDALVWCSSLINQPKILLENTSRGGSKRTAGLLSPQIHYPAQQWADKKNSLLKGMLQMKKGKRRWRNVNCPDKQWLKAAGREEENEWSEELIGGQGGVFSSFFKQMGQLHLTRTAALLTISFWNWRGISRNNSHFTLGMKQGEEIYGLQWEGSNAH